MQEGRLFYTFTRKDTDKQMSGLYMHRPKIVGIVELDGPNLKNAERMRYFKLPKPSSYPLDLTEGIEEYKHRSANYFKNKINKVCIYLMNNGVFSERCEAAEFTGPKCGEPFMDEDRIYDVITHRGVLNLLMEAPYKVGNPHHTVWSIRAIKYKSRLFLLGEKENELAELENRDANSTHHFKFEQYCFADDPLREPDTSVPVDEEQQLYCIYRARLKNINLLYSAEINGIKSNRKLRDLTDMEELNRSEFVHTKLMKDTIPNWIKNYRILSWWVKAYLAGVKDLFVGFKTDEGVVRRPLQHIPVNQLPRDQRWLPKICIQFVHLFLENVITNMRGVDSPYTCFEFIFDSNKRCINYKIHEGQTEYSFLSNDFINYLENSASNS